MNDMSKLFTFEAGRSQRFACGHPTALLYDAPSSLKESSPICTPVNQVSMRVDKTDRRSEVAFGKKSEPSPNTWPATLVQPASKAKRRLQQQQQYSYQSNVPLSKVSSTSYNIRCQCSLLRKPKAKRNHYETFSWLDAVRHPVRPFRHRDTLMSCPNFSVPVTARPCLNVKVRKWCIGAVK